MLDEPDFGYPTDNWDAYLTHGFSSWLQCVYMFILMGIWTQFLGSLHPKSWALWLVPSINFVAMIPVAALFIVSGPHASYVKVNRAFNGWMVASNIYSWILSTIDFLWFFLFWYWSEHHYIWPEGDEKPAQAPAFIGMSLAVLFQFLFTWSSKKSMRMVRCWGNGGLEGGHKSCARFYPELAEAMALAEAEEIEADEQALEDATFL